MQGYTKPREYIVTEWPLKHTQGEFWSLVYDYECSAVVVLCVPPKDSVSELSDTDLFFNLLRQRPERTNLNVTFHRKTYRGPQRKNFQ